MDKGELERRTKAFALRVIKVRGRVAQKQDH